MSGVRLDRSVIGVGDSAHVSCELTNTGSREGTEVVQVYVRDLVSSVTRPVKELKAFAKVALEAGATKTVELELPPDAFAFWDVDMHYVVEPGEFAIMVGTSSRGEDLQRVTLRVERDGTLGSP